MICPLWRESAVNWFYPQEAGEGAEHAPSTAVLLVAIAVRFAIVLVLIWAKHLLVAEYRALLSEVWYCHKLLTVVSIVSLGAHIICYYDQYTLAMSFFSITRIVFWTTLGILQLKTRKHTRKSRREVLQVNYSSSETSGYTHEEPQHRAVGFKTFMRALTSKNDSRYRSGANGAHLPLLG